MCSLGKELEELLWDGGSVWAELAEREELAIKDVIFPNFKREYFIRTRHAVC
jgi:NTP pyrophosphatase (non-canonical NTP hydrolase)